MTPVRSTLRPAAPPTAPEWQDQVLAAAKRHQKATDAMQRATEERAVAVARARRAGAGPRELGRLLGLSHPTVITLARMGERILNGDSK